MGCAPSKVSFKNTRKLTRDQSTNQVGNQGIEASSERVTFNQIPPGAIGVIHTFLDTKSLMRSTAACRLFNEYVTGGNLNIQLAQRLLEHVVRGEQVEAEALLTKSPRLLLLDRGHTLDYSGRSIKGISAWQAALCAGDTEMLAMMKPYFDSIRVTTKEPKGDTAIISGAHIRLEQTQQIFPEGFEAHVAEQAAAETVFNFGAIVKAINEANEDQLASAINLEGAILLLPATYTSNEKTNAGAANELTKALNAFRQAFTTQSLKELVFNPQHLLRALELYNAQYGDWDDKKCQVFWSQVVGFAQRFMPACYAQAFAHGLYCLTKESNPEPLRRSLKFRDGRGKIFSDGGNFLGLGFKFAVPPSLSSFGGVPASMSFAAFAPYGQPCVFKKICQTKTGYFADLCPNPCSRSGQHLSRPR